ncbi:MAG: acetyl-CoA acetyltransferase [Myxococcota bacterium]
MANGVMIIGGAQTDFARNWSRDGQGIIEILQQVVPVALGDARVDDAELGRLRDAGRIGIFAANFNGQQYCRQGHTGALLSEVSPVFEGMPGARYEAACASGSVAIDAAGTKIRAGDLDVAVVVGVEVMRTVDPRTINDYLATCSLYAEEAKDEEFLFPRMFGSITDHVLATSDIDEARLMAALDRVAEINYANARRNPNAQARRWELDSQAMQQREASYGPQLGGRTRFRDCSPVTDGGAVLLLASADYAQEHATRTGRPVARLAGWGHREAPLRLAAKLDPQSRGEAFLPWTRCAIQDAYARAGISAEDLDVIELHDCFTISEYVMLSAFGLTEPGREYEAIEQGRITSDGPMPVNPSGGLLGAGHPVGASGVRMAYDLFKQVTGQAGDYQVPGARHGAMLNIGGSFTTNVALVVGAVGS